ncbi:MAG: transglutaminase-like domain-containing protein, partial [Bacillota bacterium]|nr:transglutaminase-like domain-containing protein [Bacillota bacterium]
GGNQSGIESGKRIVTSSDPNNYIIATIEGNKVFLKGRLAYDDFHEIWVKLHYGNAYDEDMPESRDVLNDRYEKEASDFNWDYSYGLYSLGKDKTFDMEVNLKNSKINRLLVYGINRENKFPGDDDSTKDYVAIYDSYFFIEKNGSEYRFLPVREYEHNQSVMRTLKDPSKYLDTSYMSPEVKTALKSLSDRIVAGAKTDREKLLKIHDWMTAKLVYNKDFVDGQGENFNAPVDIIQNGTSQCYGFTILFTDLARLQGIPTTKAIGYIRYEPYHKSFEKYDDYGPNFNLHSWNVSYVDGKWIQIDVTWDIQSEIKNRVIQWKKSEHSYFDINLELFSHDHLLDYFREKHEWGHKEDDIDL